RARARLPPTSSTSIIMHNPPAPAPVVLLLLLFRRSYADPSLLFTQEQTGDAGRDGDCPHYGSAPVRGGRWSRSGGCQERRRSGSAGLPAAEVCRWLLLSSH